MILRNIKKRGFTLIELLVVVAIISLLSSIVLAFMNDARDKAKDARTISELRQISIALSLFYDTYGRMPRNYNFQRGTNWGACDAPVPGTAGSDDPLYNLQPDKYVLSMQELVNAGFLPSVPRSRPGSPGYCYLNFDGNFTQNRPKEGAVVLSGILSGNPTVNGIPPSCRFSGSGWCEPTSSKEYCLCNPYK